MPTLLLIRGAPGAGKSTIAKALVSSGLFDVYYEADMFFMNSAGFYQYNREKVPEAHGWCIASVRSAMRQGKNIIVSNTSVTERRCRPYKEFVRNTEGYVYQEMILPYVVFKDIHDVPEAEVKRMHKALWDSVSFQLTLE